MSVRFTNSTGRKRVHYYTCSHLRQYLYLREEAFKVLVSAGTVRVYTDLSVNDITPDSTTSLK